MQGLFAAAEQKNNLYRSVAGGGVEQVQYLHSQWDKFEMMMDNYSGIVKEQVRKQWLAIVFAQQVPIIFVYNALNMEYFLHCRKID